MCDWQDESWLRKALLIFKRIIDPALESFKGGKKGLMLCLYFYLVRKRRNVSFLTLIHTSPKGLINTESQLQVCIHNAGAVIINYRDLS